MKISVRFSGDGLPTVSETMIGEHQGNCVELPARNKRGAVRLNCVCNNSALRSARRLDVIWDALRDLKDLRTFQTPFSDSRTVGTGGVLD